MLRIDGKVNKQSLYAFVFPVGKVFRVWFVEIGRKLDDNFFDSVSDAVVF